ncbi:MAG: hypothetical protein FWD50_04905, partial [Betaproteobacteria bacterium]|nr:hypothetical protein [Betaproteobacteria bacterium]
MHKQPFAIKPVIFAVGMLGLAASFTAHAVPVTNGNYTLDAEYTIGANPGPVQDGINDPDTSFTAIGDGGYYHLEKYLYQHGEGEGVYPDGYA